MNERRRDKRKKGEVARHIYKPTCISAKTHKFRLRYLAVVQETKCKRTSFQVLDFKMNTTADCRNLNLDITVNNKQYMGMLIKNNEVRLDQLDIVERSLRTSNGQVQSCNSSSVNQSASLAKSLSLATSASDVTISINVSAKTGDDAGPVTRDASCQTDESTFGGVGTPPPNHHQQLVYCYGCNVKMHRSSYALVTPPATPKFIYQKQMMLPTLQIKPVPRFSRSSSSSSSSEQSPKTPQSARSASIEQIDQSLMKILEGKTMASVTEIRPVVSRESSHDVSSEESVNERMSVEKLTRNVITPPANTHSNSSQWSFERRVASFPDVRQMYSIHSPRMFSTIQSHRSLPTTGTDLSGEPFFKPSYFNCMDKLDFLKWKDCQSAGRYQCVSFDHDVHDLVGFSSNTTLAATDARKVNINLIKDDKKITFRAPTWPRCGRGICLSKDQSSLAVCHLTEICIYNLEGQLKRRFNLENFSSCWGITCDRDGNYVITESKHGLIHVVHPRRGVILAQYYGSARKDLKYKKGSGPEKSFGQEIFEENADGETEKVTKVKLRAPRYVACNSENQIIVTDTEERCVIVFNRDGSLCFRIGGSEQEVSETDEPTIAEAQSKRVRAKSLINFGRHDSFRRSNRKSSINTSANTPDVDDKKTTSAGGAGCNAGSKCNESRCRKLMRNLRRNTSNKSLTEMLLMSSVGSSNNNNNSSSSNFRTSASDHSQASMRARKKVEQSNKERKISSCEQSELIKEKDESIPLDPRGVCVDQYDNILVVDRQTARLLVYRPDGRYAGALLTAKDGLVEPRACCISGNNTISVTDEACAIKTYSFF